MRHDWWIKSLKSELSSIWLDENTWKSQWTQRGISKVVKTSEDSKGKKSLWSNSASDNLKFILLHQTLCVL